MAFLVYRPQDNDVIGPYESTEDCLNDPGRPGNRVFEVADFDASADFLRFVSGVNWKPNARNHYERLGAEI